MNRTRQPVAYQPATKPILRTLPKELPEIIPSSEQFNKLAEIERKLDATVTRKRFDIQDQLARPNKIKKTFRIWLSNTVTDQAWQSSGGIDETSFDFESGSIPCWTLRIEGAFTDQKKGPSFTDLFKSVIVTDDESTLLEWHRAQATPSLPGIEVKRKGDSDVNVKVHLYPLQYPEQYSIHDSLAHIIDETQATRDTIVSKLWRYVKAMSLQDTEDKRLIHCDEPLKQCFRQDRLFFPDLPSLINSRLGPARPITLEYTIRTDVELHYADTAFDVQLEIPDPFTATLESLLKQADPRVAQLSGSISDVILAIENSMTKRAFFEDFANSPVELIQRFMDSQNRDLEVIQGDVVRSNGEAARRGEYYDAKQDWLKESVFHYLSERHQLHQS